MHKSWNIITDDFAKDIMISLPKVSSDTQINHSKIDNKEHHFLHAGNPN